MPLIKYKKPRLTAGTEIVLFIGAIFFWLVCSALLFAKLTIYHKLPIFSLNIISWAASFFALFFFSIFSAFLLRKLVYVGIAFGAISIIFTPATVHLYEYIVYPNGFPACENIRELNDSYLCQLHVADNSFIEDPFYIRTFEKQAGNTGSLVRRAHLEHYQIFTPNIIDNQPIILIQEFNRTKLIFRSEVGVKLARDAELHAFADQGKKMQIQKADYLHRGHKHLSQMLINENREEQQKILDRFGLSFDEDVLFVRLSE